MYKLLPLILLSGCQLYGGASIHDRAADSEFEEEKLIATIGASKEINENLEVYIEHLSQPMYEENGYGINQAGFKIKIKLF